MTKQDIGDLPGKLYQLLKHLDPKDRDKVIRATIILFGDHIRERNPTAPDYINSTTISEARDKREPQFTARADISPKQFLLEKEPRTDVERVACLAYYLSHYRDTRYFKTIDISKLNTEAAQIKFSNTAFAVNNASRRGFITSGGKGQKQLSALGEKFVDSLPNRELAKKVLDRLKSRGQKKRTKKKKSKSKKKI